MIDLQRYPSAQDVCYNETHMLVLYETLESVVMLDKLHLVILIAIFANLNGLCTTG